MHLCQSLLKDGYQVLGIDNMNDYYDVKLKKNRLQELAKYKKFSFEEFDIGNSKKLNSSFSNFTPDKVVNLAAQAGVRHSLDNPLLYINSNVVGFMNVLECCRHYNVQGLIYASSSSVYGSNKKTPFSINDSVDNPISIYAATKKANELMAHTYSHLFNLHTTGLRFFTVYGPWGRPDMAVYIFTNKIKNSEKINVFNHGEMKRDFTYIDDIINGIRASLKKNYKYELFNLGNNHSENIMDVIRFLEKKIGKKADINFMDIQSGDVKDTFADIHHSKKRLGYEPQILINEGLPMFLEWFNSYHRN